MYTQCPKCETVFAVTDAQLAAREGRVRCGRCTHVFDARERLIESPVTDPPAPEKPAEPRPRRKASGGNGDAPRPRRRVPASAPSPTPRKTVTARATRPLFWFIGALVLTGVLIGQVLYFHGHALAREWSPLRAVCSALPCRPPPPDVARIELTEANVTPHPRFDRSLRITATLVNRAEYPQPWPHLELTLTGNQGQAVARRTYAPGEYVTARDKRRAALAPHIANQIRFDITHPDPRAAGYELALVSPPR
jgi:predicted Zn finger-like uncharacterized protein